jgi:hypothetical protein
MENTGNTLQLILYKVKFKEPNVFQLGYVEILYKDICENEYLLVQFALKLFIILGHEACMGRREFSILVRIPEGKSIFMRLRHSWNDSIKMEIKIRGCETHNVFLCFIVFYSVVMYLSNGRQDIGELQINYKITPNFLRQELFFLILYCTR